MSEKCREIIDLLSTIRDAVKEKDKELLRIKQAKNKIRRMRKNGVGREEESEQKRLDENYERTINERNLQLSKLNAKGEELRCEINSLMRYYSDVVNSHDFRFSLSKFDLDGKDVFTIGKDNYAAFLAMKQLQWNIRKTFKVKQADRRVIMSNIKVFLNSCVPVYIIRTDVTSFYESIDQARLMEMINSNTILDHKSKSLVLKLIKTYEVFKSKNSAAVGIGIPRGIGVSAYLSEIYMRDLDQLISQRNEVMFYARYVDDIFIILTYLPPGKSLREYYGDLKKLFKEYGLTIKSSGKRVLWDFFNNGNAKSGKEKTMDFLGYKLHANWSKQGLKTKYGLSDHKKKRAKERIDNAFKHFSVQSKYCLKQARKDLLDSINYITGNYQLYGSKSGIRAGLYYNNDLLDNMSDLEKLTRYLHRKELQPYKNLFNSPNAEKEFSMDVYALIKRVDFENRWTERKMYSFNVDRLKEIRTWL